jgi:5-methyltetrahydropteroyltriglutamate--homocysteine methyltransferase
LREARVKRSDQRIITTHVGSLSRPSELLTLNAARSSGTADVTAYDKGLAAAVTEVVMKQHEVGIDIANDGEFGKPMSAAYDYGAWWNYAFERLEGFASPESIPETEHKKSSVADLSLTTFARRRDWQQFSEFYHDPTSGLAGSAPARRQRRPVCVGPVRYKGHAQTKADIDHLKTALAQAGIEEGFMTSVAPASFARGEDVHYKTEEDFVAAVADAIRDEYKAIIDAGLVLQIDDPSLPDNWDMIYPEPSLEEFKKFSRVRIEALNYALRGLPEDRIRYHIREVGTVRTQPISRLRISSTSCSQSARKPIRSRPRTCDTNTSGACGRRPNFRRARSSFQASSVTPPMWSNIRA